MNTQAPPLALPYPLACPSCATPTVVKLPHLICPNPNCEPKLSGLLTHMAKRSQLDITGLGDAVAVALVRSGLVQTPADLFKLTVPQVANMPYNGTVYGQALAKKLIAGIEKANTKPWVTVLHSLGCPGLGEPQCEAIASKFSLYDLLAVMSPVQVKMALLDMHGIGEQTVLDFATWMESNGEWLYELCVAEQITGRVWLQTVPIPVDTQNQPLLGYTLTLTGSFNTHRDEYKKQLKALGAVVSDSVSKNTTAVFAGDKPGANKITGAQKNNVPVYDEQRLIKLLKEHTL